MPGVRYDAVYARDDVIVLTFNDEITVPALFLSWNVPAAFWPMVAPKAVEYDALTALIAQLEVATNDELTAFST